MRKEDKIKINDIDVIIKELTVAEVRHWMMDLMHLEKVQDDSDTVDRVLDQGLFEDIGMSDILRMTNLTKEHVSDFTPSQLRLVIERCKVLNPDFFGMRKRVLNSPFSKA